MIFPGFPILVFSALLGGAFTVMIQSSLGDDRATNIMIGEAESDIHHALLSQNKQIESLKKDLENVYNHLNNASSKESANLSIEPLSSKKLDLKDQDALSKIFDKAEKYKKDLEYIENHHKQEEVRRAEAKKRSEERREEYWSSRRDRHEKREFLKNNFKENLQFGVQQVEAIKQKKETMDKEVEGIKEKIFSGELNFLEGLKETKSLREKFERDFEESLTPEQQRQIEAFKSFEEEIRMLTDGRDIDLFEEFSRSRNR